MKVQVKLYLERVTPGTGLYKCRDEDRGFAAVQNIYLSKRATQGKSLPSEVTVTIEAEDNNL